MAATNLELIENRRSELHAAFLAFGSVSEQLSGAFDSLRSQVAQLRAELEEAHANKEHLASRLAALIKGLPGGVLVLDAGGEIRECNPVARELLGEPLLAQSFAAVLERSKANTGLVGEHTELRSGKFVNISRRELQSAGEVVLLTDVTEAHLMQVFMTRQQRLLTMGELAAGLAHQIRTPLAAALLYASQMTLPGRDAES
ncbi:MAG TPA: PAS domain-containing protein, partial [Steroidobacteraceae bacterium]|nr:PAS domain-containing protein [Steroidobacteraceae bacterium]